MEVKYKKDLHHSYMVIEAEHDMSAREYCIKLLEHQEVKGILPLERRVIDNQRMLYYEITSKQVMQSLFLKANLTFGQLKNLCEHILMTLERAYEYLLPEDDFILKPEYIYLNVSDFQPELCFFPGYQANIKDQIRSLMEYLMNKIDYTDKEAVLLVYQLYAVSREENYRFEDLKELLETGTEKSMKKQINGIKEKTDPYKEEQEKEYEEEQYEKQAFAKYAPKNENKLVQMEQQEAATVKKPYPQKRIPSIEEKIEGEMEIAFYPLRTYLYLLGCILGGISVTVLCVVSKVLFNSFGNRLDYSKLFAFCLILLCVEGYLIQKIFDKRNKITKMAKTQEYINIDVESFARKRSEKEEQREALLIKSDILNGKGRSFDKSANTSTAIIDVENSKAVNKKPTKNKVIELGLGRNNRTISFEKEEASVYEQTPGKNINRLDDLDNIERNKAQKSENRRLIDEETVSGAGRIMVDDNPDQSYNPTCLLNEELLKPEICILKSFQGAYPDITMEHYPFFIGKFRNNVDYCIEKDVISRYHAKVTREGEDYFLTDLNSTNGTYLNGEMLLTYQKKEVQFGDEITFADLKYQFLKA